MSDSEFTWYAPTDSPFDLQGFAWFERDRVYNRLPRNFPKPFRPELENLALNTAGGQIRFRTDSAQVAVRVTLIAPPAMGHMPATGQAGFDCYVGELGRQRYAGVTRFDVQLSSYESVLMQAPDRDMRSLTLNFPLYQGVQEVLVGLEPDAQLLPPLPYPDPRPVIVYGTSITQGGCASRPGMAYTNLLSRWLQRPFINLGFSGNGRGDAEIAEALAEIPNPAAYVLDYQANAGLEGLQATLDPFLDILRSAHASVPVLVVSRIRYAAEMLDPAVEQARQQASDFQAEVVARRVQAGDSALHFLDGTELLGPDFDECTVDGVHPTDLGFMRMATGLRPALETVLSPH
ncbi:MAG: hypothetical protein GX100_01545 [candidate division WS1 bacterium]|nr:hypothetical protein [candidate division WS1 bacterium]